jgi:CHASE2 domain-containing sensor protein
MIDERTEAKLGSFPYERDKTAKVIESLAQLKAKAVILKYFIDLPKTEKLDDQLAKVMEKIPVYLQAKLDSTEAKPNQLDVKNSLQVLGDKKSLLSAKSGWIPLPKFSNKSAGIGFVDAFDEKPIQKFPVVVKYQDAVYPSLALLALKEVIGASPQVEIGKKVFLKNKSVPINHRAEVFINFPEKDELVPISFLDVLEKKISQKEIEGKVVVLGYDGKNSPLIDTSIGKLKLHRAFYYSLLSLYSDLK